MYGAAYFQFRVAYLMAAGSSFPIEWTTAVEIREPQAKRNPPTIFRFYCILAVSRRCKKRSRYYEEGKGPHANVGLWIRNGIRMDARAWCFHGDCFEKKATADRSITPMLMSETWTLPRKVMIHRSRALINHTLVHTSVKMSKEPTEPAPARFSWYCRKIAGILILDKRR